MNQLPTDITQALSKSEQKLTERYSELSILRATIAAIPIVGSPLDALLGTHGQNIANARLRRTVHEIKRQCAVLDATKVDQNYLASEEFYDLVVQLFEKGQRTASDERISLYVRVLTQRIQSAPYSENAQEYLDLLSSLTEPEVRVASASYRHAPRFKEEDIVDELPGMTEDLIASYLYRLQRTGLLRYIDNTSNAMLLESADGNTCQVHDYFHKLMKFLAVNDLIQKAG